jgi:hypothetical protein
MTAAGVAELTSSSSVSLFILLTFILFLPAHSSGNMAKGLGMGNTECPTSYRTRHVCDNFTTNEDIATKFEADLPHCVRNVTTS